MFASSVFGVDLPTLTGRVNDYAQLLNDAEEMSLTETLKAFEDEVGPQIVILTMPSIGNDTLENFSLNTFKSWKLGKENKNDGVLLLFVRDIRKLRIEVGYGLEGRLPDGRVGEILRKKVSPLTKQNQFNAGFAAGVDEIISVLKSEPAPAKVNFNSSLFWKFIAMAAFVFIVTAINFPSGLIAGAMCGWFFASLDDSKVTECILASLVGVILAALFKAFLFSLRSGGGFGGGSGGWSSGYNSGSSGDSGFFGGGGDCGGGGASSDG